MQCSWTEPEHLALIEAAEEAEHLRTVLERIASFRGEVDLPKELQNGSRAAIRFYVAVEPVRIARAALERSK